MDQWKHIYEENFTEKHFATPLRNAEISMLNLIQQIEAIQARVGPYVHKVYGKIF